MPQHLLLGIELAPPSGARWAIHLAFAAALRGGAWAAGGPADRALPVADRLQQVDGALVDGGAGVSRTHC